MSSAFKNAQKSNQKTHRERGQLASRSHLGMLEKKKDYKHRAKQYHAKQDTLKVLKRKALNKNPDEFYFKMVRTRLEDGVHQCEDASPKYTEDQIKLMQSQDINYVQYKQSIENKKIEKLKGCLHLLDSNEKPKNKHIIFVDSKKQVKEFDAAKHLDTHPALLDRTYNRPRIETLEKSSFKGAIDDKAITNLAAKRRKTYNELGRRIDRERELSIISQKIRMKKHIMDKTGGDKRKMTEETPQQAASYQWMYKRKR